MLKETESLLSHSHVVASLHGATSLQVFIYSKRDLLMLKETYYHIHTLLRVYTVLRVYRYLFIVKETY